MNKIEYVIISNDQNPEYKNLFPYIKERWNDLGLKTVYVDCYPVGSEPSSDDGGTIGGLSKYTLPIRVDDFGNLEVKCSVPKAPKILDRYFHIMISRFFVAGIIQSDNIVMISDGDLFPINKRAIFEPAYNKRPVDLLKSDGGYDFVATNQYPNGDHLATYIYGYPINFRWLLESSDSLSMVYKLAESAAYETARIYMNDEHFINYQFKKLNMRVYNPGNRKWIEMCQDMNNLYDFQIDYLRSASDLAPFIELHNMRASTMTPERWNKLNFMIEEFDEMNIPPNNYFYNTIENPWRDTRITKDGELLLGDEYDN